MRTDIVHGILETVDFHHARSWTLEVAIWDLVGRAYDQPLWQVCSEAARIGSSDFSGELVVRGRARAPLLAQRDQGVRAVKLRLHSTDWRVDLPVIGAVRDARPRAWS